MHREVTQVIFSICVCHCAHGFQTRNSICHFVVSFALYTKERVKFQICVSEI